jgi:hypothetical protein
MTLCIAWIRQDGDKKELVMATDSRLTGGESWDNGIKLFELPRQDCLLCFAGGTARAYPLILNTIASIKFDQQLANPHTDIQDVLEYLVELFTNLVGEITNVGTQKIEDVRAEAEFLFCGWSWKAQDFGIWKLYYSHSLKSFTHEKVDQGKARIITYIGDCIPEAEDILEDKMRETGNLRYGTLDMEPLLALIKMSRDQTYNSIGGAIQLAKIYQSGTCEFFGIMWPSSKEQPTFLGRALPLHDLSPVRMFDPENAKIIEDIIPNTLTRIDADLYGTEFEFVEECYPDGLLKTDLSEQKRRHLKYVIQSVSYRKYCAEQNQILEAISDESS